MNKYYYNNRNGVTVIDEDDLIEELYNHYIQENNEMSHEQIMDIVMYDVNNNFTKYNKEELINYKKWK
tara:strand:- start:475 stop:678 length:204 start_codon:yes stop_codon:yes gene_type:complete